MAGCTSCLRKSPPSPSTLPQDGCCSGAGGDTGWGRTHRRRSPPAYHRCALAWPCFCPCFPATGVRNTPAGWQKAGGNMLFPSRGNQGSGNQTGVGPWSGAGGCKVASTGGSWSSGCGGSGGEETFARAVKASAGGVGVVGLLHPRLTAGTLWVKPVGDPGSLALAGQGWPWGATSCVPGRGLRDAVPEGARGRRGNGW